MYLGGRTNIVGSGSYFVIDIRGNLKPKLLPSRVPPERQWLNMEPSWKRIQRILNQASGKIWCKIVRYVPQGLRPDDLWKLVAVYGGDLRNLSRQEIYEYLSVSLSLDGDSYSWKPIKEIGQLKVSVVEQFERGEKSYGWQLCTDDNHTITPIPALIKGFCAAHKASTVDFQEMMKHIVVLISKLSIKNNTIYLMPCREDGEEPSSFRCVRNGHGAIYVVPYHNEASDLLFVSSPMPTINLNHSFARVLCDCQFKEHKTVFEQFVESFCSLIVGYDPAFDKNRVGRRMKILAHRYASVNWDGIESSLRPPYKIWLEQQGVIEITDQDFKVWAKAEVEK